MTPSTIMFLQLFVPERLMYNKAVLTYKSLNIYGIPSLLIPASETHTRSLRSSENGLDLRVRLARRETGLSPPVKYFY